METVRIGNASTGNLLQRLHRCVLIQRSGRQSCDCGGRHFLHQIVEFDNGQQMVTRDGSKGSGQLIPMCVKVARQRIGISILDSINLLFNFVVVLFGICHDRSDSVSSFR